MAGLALGFAIAGLDIQLIGARVGPRFYGTKGRTRRIAWRTAQAIAQSTGEKPPAVQGSRLRVVHHVYGGAYGRPLAAATEAATQLNRTTGVRLDSTYSAKAFVAALEAAQSEKGPTLFWLTFDGRWLTS
jgi:1-aminocyclopropane-1-carboxylate deaminase/D-cysteine desulfhydrase-like pyridoxal-dependent ACC family enzyme